MSWIAHIKCRWVHGGLKHRYVPWQGYELDAVVNCALYHSTRWKTGKQAVLHDWMSLTPTTIKHWTYQIVQWKTLKQSTKDKTFVTPLGYVSVHLWEHYLSISHNCQCPNNIINKAICIRVLYYTLAMRIHYSKNISYII